MATIAFLGLGQMGSPMANNLLQKGHSLQVFDVNAQAVDALVTQGATAAQTPAEAAAGAGGAAPGQNLASSGWRTGIQ